MELGREVLEQLLDVGTLAVFQLLAGHDEEPRYTTVFRGWHRGAHIVLDRPKAPGGAYASLHEGQECVVRFVREGLAYAFQSQVFDWDTRRASPYLRVVWPEKVYSVSFRRSQRIEIRLPCTLHQEGGSVAEAEILDLSTGGCRLRASQSFGEGSAVRLAFTLPDGTVVEGLEATVRSARKVAESEYLGCEFAGGENEVKMAIAFFVTSTLERRRMDVATAKVGQRVLVIDDNAATSKELRKQFEAHGCDVLLAANAVDGMYRLRMSPPSAVLVSQTLRNLPGADVCRLIKSLRDFAELLVYVYGGAGSGLEDAAREAGAKGYVPAGDTLAEDLAGQVLKDFGEEP